MNDRFDEEELLLPWLVNDTLSPQERERVERYLQNRPDKQSDKAFLEALRKGVQQEQVGSPGVFGLKRLQNAIQAESNQNANIDSHQVAANDTRWWKASIAAAALVILVQGGVLINMFQSQDTSYQPLSTQSAETLSLQVEFQSDITLSQIADFLMASGARISDGPSALGLYRIELDLDPSDQAAVTAVLEKFENATDIVKYVQQN